MSSNMQPFFERQCMSRSYLCNVKSHKPIAAFFTGIALIGKPEGGSNVRSVSENFRPFSMRDWLFTVPPVVKLTITPFTRRRRRALLLQIESSWCNMIMHLLASTWLFAFLNSVQLDYSRQRVLELLICRDCHTSCLLPEMYRLFHNFSCRYMPAGG